MRMREYGLEGELPTEHVDLAVEVFRMLSDATRVRLLWAIRDEELSVSELVARVGKAQASVSQHLAKLRMARLVTTRRDGNTVYYRLENNHVAQLVRDAIHNAEHASGGVPRHHSDEVANLAPIQKRADV